MKTVIREITWLPFNDHGFANGYVLIPEGHFLHGVDYEEIDVNVHGGLTFSELVDAEIVEKWKLKEEDKGKWIVGFDTAHSGDTLYNWPLEKVQQETERLRDQLMNYANQ